MKKIYLRESQVGEELLLPKFLFKAVIDHRTSLGDNPAFPEEDDFPFDYAVLKERFKDVCLHMKDAGMPLGNKDELLSELGAMVKEARELEKPIKDSLEKLCENAVNRLFAIPEDMINLKCVLVDKVENEIPIGVKPEDSSGRKFRFKDIKDFGLSKKAIAKRRLINSLIMGASEYYTSMVSLYQEDLNKLNPDLLPLYDKILILNRYLTFITDEEISDKNQKQGSFVEVHIGTNGDKTTINAQGIIFPLLLHDTIKGFFELFSVHGLPRDAQKAIYIVNKSDFLLAEPWDMRFGGKLWQLIFDREELSNDTNLVPYVFMKLVKLPADEFNPIMQEIFMGTEKGEEMIGDFIERSKYNDGYQKFKNRINARNLSKSIIADSYFTASELYGYDIDGDDEDGDIIEEDSDESNGKIEDVLRKSTVDNIDFIEGNVNEYDEKVYLSVDSVKIPSELVNLEFRVVNKLFPSGKKQLLDIDIILNPSIRNIGLGTKIFAKAVYEFGAICSKFSTRHNDDGIRGIFRRLQAFEDIYVTEDVYQNALGETINDYYAILKSQLDNYL